ncbi:MAG TPA: ABC transporter permease subunit/CPBP intramembrane protease [Candidatus Hydrogenedentes bacterium]|jgi:sodium transport system permease protein|nr:ABC transporter permease subunit/CPBP intramembrane protease [Candidatus Hydrogenedentota bacterium]HPJ98034.1 ABC transporter permease subunit/CPBP intramembrane protease [Candidatus Hydrogenedentota bacterium]
MKMRTVRAIFFKELMVMLRDKRTLVAMIGIPVVLYPVLLVVTSQVALMHISHVEESTSRIAIKAGQDPTVAHWIDALPRMKLVSMEKPEAALLDGEVDAVVVVKQRAEEVLERGGSLLIVIQYDSTVPQSREAAHRLSEGLRTTQTRLLEDRLAKAGITLDFVTPLKLQEMNVAPAARIVGTLLAAMLPMIMVLMVGIGAFYPAVDLTAGEKERGTFETLLSTPATKFEIVCGKFLTVFCISMLTGLLNLASMAMTFIFHLSDLLTRLQVGPEKAPVQFPLGTALLMTLLLIPLALFVSALMMSVAVLARTFKEAQNYVTPFFLLITIPAGLAGMPGLELNSVLQFVPIVNIGLLFRDLLTDRAKLEAVFSVLLSTSAFALLALVCATWLFQREDVILSEEKGVPLTLRRSRIAPRGEPTVGMAMTLYTLILLLIFYVGVYAQSKHMLGGLLITEWLVIALPTVALLWYLRVDLLSALHLRAFRIDGALATAVIALSWLVLAFQLGLWHSNVLPMPEDMAKQYLQLIHLEDTSLVVLLAVIAVSPAICEEILFRGAILSGLEKRLPAWLLIPVVGLLFGAFHLSIYRVLLTGLTGMVLTYVVWRTRSLWNGILLHCLFNASAVLMASERLPEKLLTGLRNLSAAQAGLPWWLIGLAASAMSAGIGYLHLRFPDPNRGPSE